MADRRNLEMLLRQLPVSTPEERDATGELMNTFVSILNGVLQGLELHVEMGQLNVSQFVEQLRQGQYLQATETLIGICGTATAAVAILTEAALEARLLSSLSATAQAGTVAAGLAEILGIGSIGIMTFLHAMNIPNVINEDFWKRYYIVDVSGILTSWIFARRELSPHRRLTAEARHGGYFRTDVSDACAEAHRRAHQMWQTYYSGNPALQASVRNSAGNDWQEFWRKFAHELEAQLGSIGAESFAQRLIRETRDNIERRRREEETAQRNAARRRDAGGVWLTPPGGLAYFEPDT